METRAVTAWSLRYLFVSKLLDLLLAPGHRLSLTLQLPANLSVLHASVGVLSRQSLQLLA